MPYIDPSSDQAKQNAKERRNRWRSLNRDKYLQQLRETAQRHKETRKKWASENRESIRENVRRWRLANVEKHRAHKAVRYAVKVGKLIRPDYCLSCNSIGKIQAHHPNGYDKKHYLDVVWLCSSCHKKLHRKG